MEVSRESKSYSRTSVRSGIEFNIKKVETEEKMNLLRARDDTTPGSYGQKSSVLDNLVVSQGYARDQTL